MISILGHRGGGALWPENSLAGFRNAIALGIDAVELDVHVSRDGEVVVIHDNTLERTTHGTGFVQDRTSAELGTTRLRDTDEGVPTLEAVLDLFEPASTELFVELKTDAGGRAYPGLEQRVVDMLARRGMIARAGILCFVPEILETVRRVEPAIRLCAPVVRATAQMHGGLERMLDRLDTIPDCLVSVERSLLLHAREYCIDRLGPGRLCAGVINDPDELDFWMTQNVHQVVSDRPDLALAARKRHLAG